MPKPKIQFPKLTSAQCQTVVDWVTARMRPLADVLAELERPEVLAYLDANNYPRLDPLVKTLAANATLQVGGGNGGTSWKPNPSYQDIDLFMMIPSTPLTDQQTGQLRALLAKRLTDEIFAQRDGVTIEGVAATVNGRPRQFDIGKVGTLYKGVIWSVPNYCRHCNVAFNDGKFVVVNGVITYEAHVGL